MPQLNTRVQHKRDTYANWSNKSTFVPLDGELIIYSDGKTGGSKTPAVKIGDGTTTLGNLKFVGEEYVPLTGGTMTGKLTLSGAPTSNLHAATKKYVDDKMSSAGGGKYEQHCWLKTGYAVPQYSAIKNQVSTGQSLATTVVGPGTIQIGTAYTMEEDSDGVSKFRITNARTFSWTVAGGGSASDDYRTVTDSQGTITTTGAMMAYLRSAEARPYYLIQGSGLGTTLFEVPTSANFAAASSPDYTLAANGVGASGMYQYSINTTYDESTVGYKEVLYSTSANAYTEGPDGNGYNYAYIGIPSNVLIDMITLTGEYRGTGTFGSNKPCSLVFSRMPKLIIITPNPIGSNTTTNVVTIISTEACRSSYTTTGITCFSDTSSASNIITNMSIKKENNTIYWYTTSSADTQLNANTMRYNWVAIG